MKKIFIHGSSGTTGLRIRQRLSGRGDLELIVLPEEKRHDPDDIRLAINQSDVTFLCLPDDAAMEAVSMCDEAHTVIIDASTAHRTLPGWVYGFPELSQEWAEAIRNARRIAVPGCHASGFVALVAPLVSAGLLPADTALTCFSLTGYSGGGKSMIAQYEGAEREALLGAPRQYGLTQRHKHLPEMVKVCGLTVTPVFCPIVADFYSGMEVTVPLFATQLKGSMEDVKAAYRALYTGPVVKYIDGDDGDGFLSAAALSGRDTMQISVLGNGERLLLTARFDNLGKGASGAAVQCMNLVLGIDPTTGLEL